MTGNVVPSLMAFFVIIGISAFFLLFFLGVAAFWIWMLVDCLTKEPAEKEGNTKLIWVLVIIFANMIGALIYFLVRRPERKRLYGA